MSVQIEQVRIAFRAHRHKALDGRQRHPHMRSSCKRIQSLGLLQFYNLKRNFFQDKAAQLLGELHALVVILPCSDLLYQESTII
jgi:hypothetical protein